MSITISSRCLTNVHLLTVPRSYFSSSSPSLLQLYLSSSVFIAPHPSKRQQPALPQAFLHESVTLPSTDSPIWTFNGTPIYRMFPSIDATAEQQGSAGTPTPAPAAVSHSGVLTPAAPSISTETSLYECVRHGTIVGYIDNTPQEVAQLGDAAPADCWPASFADVGGEDAYATMAFLPRPGPRHRPHAPPPPPPPPPVSAVVLSDGVSSWRHSHGISSGLFSRALGWYAAQYTASAAGELAGDPPSKPRPGTEEEEEEESPLYPCSAASILWNSVHSCLQQNPDILGSATLCVAALAPDTAPAPPDQPGLRALLEVANVGDCGILVLRPHAQAPPAAPFVSRPTGHVSTSAHAPAPPAPAESASRFQRASSESGLSAHTPRDEPPAQRWTFEVVWRSRPQVLGLDTPAQVSCVHRSDWTRRAASPPHTRTRTHAAEAEAETEALDGEDTVAPASEIDEEALRAVYPSFRSTGTLVRPGDPATAPVPPTEPAPATHAPGGSSSPGSSRYRAELHHNLPVADGHAPQPPAEHAHAAPAPAGPAATLSPPYSASLGAPLRPLSAEVLSRGYPGIEAELSSVGVREGDLVIAGSDGLFDNLYTGDMVRLAAECYAEHELNQAAWRRRHRGWLAALRDWVDRSRGWQRQQQPAQPHTRKQAPPPPPQVPCSFEESLAARLGDACVRNSLDKTWESPYAAAAKDDFVLWSGGRVDDVCVVVSRVQRVQDGR